VLRHDRHGADLEDAEERAEGLLQGEAHRMVAECLDGLDVLQADAQTGMGLAQEDVGREDHVGRGEGLAVVPGHAFLEPEGVDLAVVADLPGGREARHRLELVVVSQQALVDVAGDHLGRAVLDDAQHQPRRLRLDHEVERPAVLRLLGCRGAGDRQDRPADDGTGEQGPSRSLHHFFHLPFDSIYPTSAAARVLRPSVATGAATPDRTAERRRPSNDLSFPLCGFSATTTCPAVLAGTVSGG